LEKLWRGEVEERIGSSKEQLHKDGYMEEAARFITQREGCVWRRSGDERDGLRMATEDLLNMQQIECKEKSREGK